MHRIKPAYSPVKICCACNENYAPPLAVCLYSLLSNADPSRVYDIVILHSDISQESREPLKRLGTHFPNCTIHFVDMTDFRESVKDCTHAYITAETNYRVAENDTFDCPAAPTAPVGRKFTGWFAEDGTEYDLSKPVAKDLTITAKFADCDINGIAVTAAPEKQSYKEGDKFVPAGLKIEVTYDDKQVHLLSPAANSACSHRYKYNCDIRRTVRGYPDNRCSKECILYFGKDCAG